jgi:hypothetical protein
MLGRISDRGGGSASLGPVGPIFQFRSGRIRFVLTSEAVGNFGKSPMKKRAQNLTDERIRTIIELIDVWDGPFSWDNLIRSIQRRTGQVYTRQALAKKASIAEAFSLRKRAPREITTRRKMSPELSAALARIERLQRRLDRAETQNAALMEQFVKWAYNARIRGLSLGYLNQPLPSVDRDRTVLKPGRRSPLTDPAG